MLRPVLAWRELIRMRTSLTLPQYPAGAPSPALPTAADILATLDLW